MSVFDGDKEFSQEEIQALVLDEISRRRAITPGETIVGGSLATMGGDMGRTAVHQSLGKAIRDEYQDIREDPERQRRQMDEMERTYKKFVEKTGNPVEFFIPKRDTYAAARLPDGSDVVMYDPSAPHAGIMAHELGHVHMNHQTNPLTDPLAWLQTSGVGRESANHAVLLGSLGAGLGAAGGQLRSRFIGSPDGRNHLRNQMIGTAVGGGLGTLASSGQAAYEMLGATGRAFEYLPDDVSKADVAGDLGRAGLTYVLGGPGQAAVAATGIGAAALAAAHAPTRQYVTRRAGDALNSLMNRG